MADEFDKREPTPEGQPPAETPAAPPPTPEHKVARPGLHRNLTTWIGSAIAVIALANVLFLLALDLVGVRTNPYIGILAYMVLPAVLLFGLLLVPVGMLLERRRRRRALPDKIAPYPRIDLNDPRQRSGVVFLLVGSLFFLMLTAIGSYRAHEYTDSVEFCGELCHVPMKPEMMAYQASPHARVRCVDCHVGEGAGWYVKSKLSGAYQVYAVTFNKFPRPIPTPVHNLRPAPDTCEQCHWPRKFFGAQLKVYTHYGADEKNTPRQIRMLLKVGGGDPSTSPVAGIHWHMNIGNEVTYIATDEHRQTIPWVRIKDMQGRVTVYQSKTSPLKPEEIEKLPKRRMDCVDCHNRPSHIYVPPDRSVDDAIFAGRISQTLPFIKQQAVEHLVAEYPSEELAMEGIATGLDRFYLTKYPDLYKARQADIRQAIAETQRIFQTTIFPEMKVDWRTHPNNIGHFYNLGCFRCHNGDHESAEGKIIRKECEICHTVIAQEESGSPVAAMKGGEFKHPVDLGDMTAVLCSDCHTGGISP